MDDRFVDYMMKQILQMERNPTDWFTVAYAPIYRTILANYRTLMSEPLDAFDNDMVGAQ